MSLFWDHLCLSTESCLTSELWSVPCLFIAQPIQHPPRRHQLSSYNAHWGKEAKQTEVAKFRWETSSLVQMENSDHITHIHTAMQQPRKPGSGTLRQNSESKTYRGLQTQDNIVWPPTGVRLTSLMIPSSYPGIMTLGVVMVLHNQHRLHLPQFKNYLSVLSLCQVMPKTSHFDLRRQTAGQLSVK